MDTHRQTSRSYVKPATFGSASWSWVLVSSAMALGTHRSGAHSTPPTPSDEVRAPTCVRRMGGAVAGYRG